MRRRILYKSYSKTYFPVPIMVLENARNGDIHNVAASHEVKSDHYAVKLCEIGFFSFKTKPFAI